MLNFYALTIQTESGERAIYVSPLLLQSKKRPNLKSGKVEKLYFYCELMDDDYYTGLELYEMKNLDLPDYYIINYGQDFERYYIGSFRVDYDTRSYRQWEGTSIPFSKNDVKALAECLFTPDSKSRRATIFTPTPPFRFQFYKVLAKLTDGLICTPVLSFVNLANPYRKDSECKSKRHENQLVY